MSRGQNPRTGKKHGPKKRRQVYQEAIERVFREEQGWLSADEIARKANDHISAFWTQLNCYSASAILRVFVANNTVISHKNGIHPTQYRIVSKNLKKIP